LRGNSVTRSRLKKITLLFFIVLLYPCCGSNRISIERITEEGVEVVLNQIDPYTLKGEPSSLTLEEELSIDTADDSVAELGLTDIWAVNVDNAGNIYLWNSPRSTENLVYKFNSNGKFQKSFLKRGQGPDEIQSPNLPIVTSINEFVVTDYFPKKLIYLNFEGEKIKEVALKSRAWIVYPLVGGNYFVTETIQAPNGAYSDHRMVLYNSSMEELKQLMIYREDDPRTATEVNGTMIDRPYLLWAVSKDRIYVGDNDQREYEILVCDFDGNLLRKIRRDYLPVEVTDEYKKSVLAPYDKSPMAMVRDIAKRIVFPKYMPPYQSLFCDDEGRLYVMTFEQDEYSESYIVDVFNPVGFFIHQTSIGNYAVWERIVASHLVIIAKNNKVYCRRRDEGGYMKLVVYKMIWN
jgi:hypothetical protein